MAHGRVEGPKVGSKEVCGLILQRDAVPCNTTAETEEDKNSFVTDPGTLFCVKLYKFADHEKAHQ